MPVITIGDNTADDFAGTEDAYFRSDAPTSNYGSDATIRAYGSTARNGVLSFSGFANVPAGATINDITQYIYNTSGITSSIFSFRRVLLNWVEAQITWNIYSTGNNWNTAGGLGDDTDRSSTVSGTVTVTTTGWYSNSDAQWITDHQNFLDGTWNNYGYHIQNGTTTFGLFASSEGTDGQRPYIEIDYTAGGGYVPPFGGLSGKSLSGSLGGRGV